MTFTLTQGHSYSFHLIGHTWFPSFLLELCLHYISILHHFRDISAYFQKNQEEMWSPAICYLHRRLSPQPDTPDPGVMACHSLTKTQADPLVPCPRIISCRNLIWHAGRGGTRTPALPNSQPGGLTKSRPHDRTVRGARSQQLCGRPSCTTAQLSTRVQSSVVRTWLIKEWIKI